MNRAAIMFATGMAALAAPLAGQTPPAPPAIEEPDADRVEEARELLDLIMPPAQRAAMMIQMIEPSMANVEQGLMESPQFMEAMREDPQTQQLFIDLMRRQRAATNELLTASLPGLINAMSRAYARRFSVRQLRDMREFFESDTGQAYLAEAPAIMADPDVGAWQRNLTTQSMAMMEQEINALLARIGVNPGGAPAQPNRPVTSSNLDAMRGGGDPAASEQPNDDRQGEE